MFTVIKLGGVNGSGKSTLARAVMGKVDKLQPCSVDLPSGKRGKVYLGRYDGQPIVILGKYETACGGADTISDKDDRLWLLDVYCKGKNIVFYEGLITGKTYGAMGAMSEDHVAKRKGRWLYAFMDTPFDVCVDRVLQRRRAAGNLAPFDAERTMRSTYKSCEALARKLQDGTLPAHPVHMVNHKHKPAKAAELLMAKALEMHYGKK